MIKFTIPRITDSLNVQLRQHWAIKRRLRDTWEWEIKFIRLREKWPEASTKKKVVITSYRKRRMDYDNLVGSLKICVDCLTRNKLIVDDSPEWVEVEYRQEIDGKNTRTEIEIKDFAFPGHNDVIARTLKSRRGL